MSLERFAGRGRRDGDHPAAPSAPSWAGCCTTCPATTGSLGMALFFILIAALPFWIVPALRSFR
jgi:hypothetical protein